MKVTKVGAWVEAMRFRTLPVSVAGVLMGIVSAKLLIDNNDLTASSFLGMKVSVSTQVMVMSLLCLLFAVLAQVASNFANEYYDYRAGFDKVGRDGPRRGVTEGDITPSAMLKATWGVLIVACVIGLMIAAAHNDWWLIAIGVFIAAGVFAYSAGPYPLSRHGLGEVAVLLFYGVVPVCFTCYVVSGRFSVEVFLLSLAVGLMGANVLIVNNYRDYDDDKSVGKKTLCVVTSRTFMLWLYGVNGLMASVALWRTSVSLGLRWTTSLLPVAYLVGHLCLNVMLYRRKGKRLNAVLAYTSILMFLVSLGYYCCA